MGQTSILKIHEIYLVKVLITSYILDFNYENR